MSASPASVGTEQTLASEAIEAWYGTPLGERVGQELANQVAALARDAFGYHALSLGGAARLVPLAEQLRIHHYVRLGAGMDSAARTDLVVDYDALPIESEGSDLVIGWHVLENRRNPHEILREMDRILRPEGRLILVGVNPTSLLHLSWLLRRGCHRPIHAGTHHAPWRVVDWLRVLGYEINSIERAGGLLPLCGLQQYDRLAGVQCRVGNWAWFLSSFYIISATRRILNPTQLKPAFRLSELIGSRVPGKIAGKVASNTECSTSHD